MRFPILRSPVSKVVILAVFLAAMLPFASPAHATTAAIGVFWANCGQFSVDVAVSGVNNDGNNQDKFRYQITDATGKLLYIEDATRQVSTTLSSYVVNLNFNSGQPAKNPIKFSVIELDGNSNAGAEIQSVTYDASCLAASGVANRFGTFVPLKNVGGDVITTTNIYQGPNSGMLNMVVGAGSSWNVIYRSADSQWVAIFVGSSNLVWIPAKTIRTDLSALVTPPSRIDASSLKASPGSNTGSIPLGPVTAVVLVDNLNMRAGPASNAAVLTTIPYKTVLPVFGRSRGGGWLKVNFNGDGWVSSRFVRLSGATLFALPIVS